MLKKYEALVIFIYAVVLTLFSIYSYALIDPNLTLINNAGWQSFRDPMVYFGYYQRFGSAEVYIVLITLLFTFHHLIISKLTRVNAYKLSLVIGVILFFAYPFLSHDFFNYLFDAKIFTYYHQNPYVYKGLDFPADDWLRFMHWTHRSYPYGPVFLVLSIIPSFLSFGKFILSYALFKVMYIGFYLWTVYLLNKKNSKTALQFATHPLVIVEGLIALHNDLIALCLGVIGICYFLSKQTNWSKVFVLLSAGIKYITFPFIVLGFSQKKNVVVISFLMQVALLVYLTVTSEIQPWYFLALLGFIPFMKDYISKLSIFFAGLLLSYYPYIALGEWTKKEYVDMKHQIILVFFVINIIYLGYIEYRKKSISKK